MKTPAQAVARYASDNLTAARIVLRDVAKYGGNEAGLVVWARLVLAKEELEARGWRSAA